MSVFCTNCGKEIPEQSQYCPMCGTITRHTISAAFAVRGNETGPFCPACGRRTVEGGGFCKWCGVNIHTRPFSAGGMACPMCGEKLVNGANFCSRCRHDLAKWFITGDGRILGGRYRLGEKTGSGSMGIVYKAYDLKLKMEVAVKLVPPELARNKNAVDQLRSEAQTALKITHPNITRLYTFEEDGENVFLVMEYVPGETLEKLIREKGKIPEEQAILIGLDVLKGLGAAHASMVIHRDLKPGNIIVLPGGGVKILDFGIARKIKETMTRFSISTGPTSGTLLYMAPEQIRGMHETAQTDIYSFGAVMYELLSGNPPFFRGAIEHQILNEQPVRIKGISGRMNDILARCMAKEPAERYVSTLELSIDLGVALSGRRKDEGKSEKAAPAPIKTGPLEISENAIRIFKQFRKTAERGDKDAFNKLMEAAEKGDAEAQFNLGWMYENDEGIYKDAAEAAGWYRKAAEQGHSGAQFNLGLMCCQGHGIQKDTAEAVKLFRWSAEQKYKDAIRWFKINAEDGDPEAQLNLGYMYYKGEGVQRDSEEAANWFSRAAKKGNIGAKYKLGLMYSDGEGVDRDIPRAIKLISEAARQGHRESMECLVKIAEEGKATAQIALGLMYRKGEGVEKNDVEAAAWFLKAAEQGDARAQFNLGLMYFRGEGVARDVSEANRLIGRVADSGLNWKLDANNIDDAMAYALLGNVYFNRKNFRHAAQLLKRALPGLIKMSGREHPDTQSAIEKIRKLRKVRTISTVKIVSVITIILLFVASIWMMVNKHQDEEFKRLVAESSKNSRIWSDSTTRLIWQNPPADKELNWETAVRYCKNLIIEGKSGWHLPSIDELKTLLTPEKSNECYWKAGLVGACTWYWSSTPGAHNMDIAWFVNFSPDLVNIYTDAQHSGKSHLSGVRCVRNVW